jgi:hypothetical protein
MDRSRLSGGPLRPKPSCSAGCQRRSTRGLRQTVHACPLASTAGGGDYHSLRHSIAREPVVSDCFPHTLSKSARLGPAQVRWVRDLGCLFRVVYAERRSTLLNETNNETRACLARGPPGWLQRSSSSSQPGAAGGRSAHRTSSRWSVLERPSSAANSSNGPGRRRRAGSGLKDLHPQVLTNVPYVF